MRVLWTHNFNPDEFNGQMFIKTASTKLEERGVELHFEYLGNLCSVANLLRARRRLQRMASGFDIVHAQYGSACAFATSAIEGIPKVLSIRGNDWSPYSCSIGVPYFHSRLARMMTRWSLERYDRVLPVSQRIAHEIKRYLSRPSVSVMPSPIDLNKFIPRDRKEARRMLGFGDCSKKWVLFTAAYLDDPVKRFNLAKKAFDIADAKCGNLRLLIATNIPHDRMPLLTAASDVVLCTSETEGWPNSVKEALACNVPFVSTDVGDLREIAQKEPICRISPADPAALAENICDVLASPAAHELRRHVIDMGLDVAGDRLVSIYKSLISRRR